jgi:hypothetical protein
MINRYDVKEISSIWTEEEKFKYYLKVELAHLETLEEEGIAEKGTVELIQKVRFVDNKLAGDQENELPSNLVDCQKEALDKVRQALASNGWVVEEKEGESALYQVAIDRDGNYEICEGMPIPNLRPLLPIKNSEAQVISIHQELVRSVELLNQAILAQKITTEQLKRRLLIMRKKYEQARVSLNDIINDQDALLNSELSTIQTRLQLINLLFDYFATIFQKY